TFAAVIAALWAGMAWANDALLIGNSRYDAQSNLRQPGAIPAAAAELNDAGFNVIVGRNLSAVRLRQGLRQLVEQHDEGLLVIGLSGHFVRGADGETWLLGTDADRPSRADIDTHAMALSAVLAIAAEAPGEVVVLVGTEARSLRLAEGLSPGFGSPDVPQGVSLVSGPAQMVARFLGGGLLNADRPLRESVRDSPGLELDGFAPRRAAFMAPESAGEEADAFDPEDAATWRAADELDTEGAYRAYLRRYPNGANAREARARLEAIENNPEALAEAAEEDLALSRNLRRDVQRFLTALGHDTRGIDGIFGPGTRAALRDWQAAEGLPVSGYLDRAQLIRLSRDGEAAIAAEAAAEARRDRAFWRASGEGSDEAGLRAYLERYPNGLFADIARGRLEVYDAAAADAERAAREVEDRAFWARVTSDGSASAYQAYLESFPEGLFADQARDRLAELSPNDGLNSDGLSDADRAQLQRVEESLGLPRFTLQLLERRLDAFGLEPGPVDGRLDAQSRQALARYQTARSLTATGYLDQMTLIRLMADTVEDLR
ncbi:MAG: peptidoglycan-binding protein, partial [Pseudomonadota bacterium]